MLRRICSPMMSRCIRNPIMSRCISSGTIASSGQALPSAAICVLYRELLRACGNGAWPETLAVPVSWSEPSYEHAPRMPRSSREVRKCVREGFTNPQLAVDPFAALRAASAHARALHPREESIPDVLPAFVLPSHLLLPGERADFMLFEPRYVALARHVLATATEQADGRYVHIDDPRGFGTITTILDHRWLPDGRVAIHCLAGPRIRVTNTARLEAAAPSDADERAAAPAVPPLLHVHFEVERDAPEEEDHVCEALARDCLERLAGLAPLDKEPTARANLPPLLCAERLSFWLGQMLLAQDDVKRRRHMLTQTSTFERLAFISESLDHITARTVAATAKGGAKAVEDFSLPEEDTPPPAR